MKRITKSGMEISKDIIITLILADLKHNQLLGNLRKIAFHTDEYAIRLYEAIAQLMGLGNEPDEEWFEIYDNFLLNAHKHPVSDHPDSLQSVAEECYALLCASVKVKNHLNTVEVI